MTFSSKYTTNHLVDTGGKEKLGEHEPHTDSSFGGIGATGDLLLWYCYIALKDQAHNFASFIIQIFQRLPYNIFLSWAQSQNALSRVQLKPRKSKNKVCSML